MLRTADFERFLRDAFPLDAPPACYVVRQTELPEEFQSTAAAYTGSNLSRQLRPFLEQANRWRGEGFAVVVGDVVGSNFVRVARLLIHELGHNVTCAPGPVEGPDPFGDKIQQIAQDIGPGRMNEWADRVRDLFRQPQWMRGGDHGMTWIRATLHLVHRAQRQGIAPDPGECFIAGAAYGLSPAGAYWRALAPEIAAAEFRPVAEILQAPAPSEFVKLWETDTAQWPTPPARTHSLVSPSTGV